MQPIPFTRDDFNQLLSFGDVRTSEFWMTTGGRSVTPFEVISEFVSSHDVITDYGSARKVASLVHHADKFGIYVSRNYPWHEALILDCLELTMRHRHAYSPVVIAGKNEQFMLSNELTNLPLYARRIYGEVSPVVSDVLQEFPSDGVHANTESLLVAFRPNRRVQRELILRMFRTKAAQATEEPIFLRDTELANSQYSVEDVIRRNDLGPNDEDLFYKILLQLWPCGSFGRLSTFILLSEGETNLVATSVPWTTRIVSNQLRDISGKILPPSSEAEEIARRHPDSVREYARSSATDALALHGLAIYAKANDWRKRGWPVAVSRLDPTLAVRTDGVLRWLCLPHGGVESIEHVTSGRNKTIGGGFLQQYYRDVFIGKKLLFLGLGLGVLQRSYVKNCLVETVEINPAVVELFHHLYPACPQDLHIHIGDFFEFLEKSTDAWDAMFLDYFDPAYESLEDDRMALMQQHLKPGGLILLNRQGGRDEFTTKLDGIRTKLGVTITVHELLHEQTVAAIEVPARPLM